jgi:hypothetical protein
MKKIISVLLALIVAPAYSATTPAPRVSIFSTSTDWQAVTGLTLNEYSGKFISDKKLVGRGLVLYYLDGFPCYGLGFGVRVWIGPDGKSDNDLAIACVAAPTEIKFAYRNATRDADQATTTGILTCPVSDRGRDLTIDLSDCIVGPDWDEYK